MSKEATSPQILMHPELPTLRVADAWDWERVLAPPTRGALEAIVAAAVKSRRWFGAKARTIRTQRIVDAVPIGPDVRLALIEFEFTAGPAEVYQLPLGFADGDRAARLLGDSAGAAWARVQIDQRPADGLLYDALADPGFCAQLLALIETQARLDGGSGTLIAEQDAEFPWLRGDAGDALSVRALQLEQSNTSIAYGERLILKLYRRVERGANPDLEISEYLTARGFAHSPPTAGTLRYEIADGEHWPLGMLQRFVPNQGDAWGHTLKRLAELSTTIATTPVRPEALPSPTESICQAATQAIPAAAQDFFGAYLQETGLLGVRTAQMHLTLAAGDGAEAFASETFTAFDMAGWSERCRRLANEAVQLTREHESRLPDPTRPRAQQFCGMQETLQRRFEQLTASAPPINKIRVHGDYHLGQVLSTGDDFFIIDFEGEPARPLVERRAKQLALRDVAGMIRSFHYAACTAATQSPSPKTADGLAAWYFWASVAFLQAYRKTTGDAPFLPSGEADFARLLDLCLLEKAVYELRYELNNRPTWVYLPLGAIFSLLGIE